MRGYVISPGCGEDQHHLNSSPSARESSRVQMAESQQLSSRTNDKSCRSGGAQPPLRRQNTIETNWLEFNGWLETRLEELGLDANLYSRLIHSVLRQQPDAASDVSDSWRDVNEWHKSSGNAAVDNPIPEKSQPDREALSRWRESVRVTLAEILPSDTDKWFISSLVEEMVNRYCELRTNSPPHEGRVNDSVDSGVCPSPDESFQNYDEAFPPLSDSCCDELTFFAASLGSQDNLVATSRGETEPTGVKWPVDRKERRYQGRLSDSSNSSGTSVASVVSATPSKKLKCENEAGKQSTVATHKSRNPPLTRKLPHHRPLNSCPDLLQHQHNNFSCGPSSHRYQMPKAPLQSSSFSFPAYPSGMKTENSPYFLVPKCRKTSPVSSCGSSGGGKLRKRHWSGGKTRSVAESKFFTGIVEGKMHTEDIPAWQCNEWVCPVHRGAEFNFWSSRIGGLADVNCRSCAKQPQSHDGIFHCDDEDTMEIGVSPGQLESVGSNSQSNSPESSSTTSSTTGSSASGGVNMFDAPQFILHIINEDSSSSPPPITAAEDCSKLPTTFGEDLQWTAEENNIEKWGEPKATVWGNATEPQLAPEFTFSVIREKFSSPYDNVGSDPVAFCLPKFSTIQSTNESVQLQPNSLSQLFSLVGMANGSFPGAPQSLPFGLTNLLPILSEQLLKGAAKVELSPVKSQPPPLPQPPPPQQQQPTFYPPQQQLQQQEGKKERQPVKVPAIPVSPQTHFVPIRAESMEDAYYPKPGFDEVNTWISPEGYHILQPSGNNNHHVTNWRSLPLKFKTFHPEKSCQTDESLLLSVELDLSNSGCAAELPDVAVASMPTGATVIMPDIITHSATPLEADTPPTIQSNMPSGGKTGLNEVELTPVWKTGRSFSEGTAKVDSAEIFSCPPVEFDSSSESRLWRCLDEQDEDQLLRYVSNISLLSPLDPAATTTLV